MDDSKRRSIIGEWKRYGAALKALSKVMEAVEDDNMEAVR